MGLFVVGCWKKYTCHTKVKHTLALHASQPVRLACDVSAIIMMGLLLRSGEEGLQRMAGSLGSPRGAAVVGEGEPISSQSGTQRLFGWWNAALKGAHIHVNIMQRL
jgi:hypothetical protein